MTESILNLSELRSFSPVVLACSVSAVTAFAGWLYLHMIRWAPTMNLVVLLAGIALLMTEPASRMGINQTWVLDSDWTVAPLIVAIGLALVGLAMMGRLKIRQYRSHERLRRKLWDRVAGE